MLNHSILILAISCQLRKQKYNNQQERYPGHQSICAGRFHGRWHPSQRNVQRNQQERIPRGAGRKGCGAHMLLVVFKTSTQINNVSKQHHNLRTFRVLYGHTSTPLDGELKNLRIFLFYLYFCYLFTIIRF